MKNTQLPLKVPFFYGWVIVFISAMTVFFSGPGQTYSISIFIDAYIKDFGWSSTLVSTMYMFATVAAGFLLFLVGRAVDKYGPRKMVVIVSSLLGFASLFNSFITGPVMLFLGFFMLRLFGQGSMTLIPGTLVPQWFLQMRGRALSFMAIGGFASSALLPPLNAWMIDTFTWPVAWRIWAALLLLFFVPTALFFVRNKPEDVGLLPDGVSENSDSDSSKESDVQETVKEDNWTLKEAMRTKSFWFILFCVGVPSMVNTGIVFHFISIMGDQGISRQTAAFILSLMAFISFPISLVAGVVVDKVKVNYVLGCTFIGQILIMVLLAFTVNEGMAIAFGIARGLVGGFEMICLNMIWPTYFGRKHLGSIKGIAVTLTVLGSAFGPLPLALAFDYLGGFKEMILLMMIFPVIAMFLAFFSSKPDRDSLKTRVEGTSK
ncbi:MFS transporter [Evansella sp. AB-rgal1]|uniref:MFS transporter n=1 Tax=Evansella sp. AB-rgal1 TaxID=3242696 RepID=UPI00359CCDFE